MSCGSNTAANQLANQQAQQQAWTNQAIGNINNAFAGFTPAFYNQAATNYTNYATPQLQQQFQTNKNQLVNNLADQGILNSSAAQQANNALSAAMTQGQQGIANAALGQQQQLQQQVAQQENALYQQAQTTTNPQQIGQQALTTAANINAPSTFTPIGNAFSNFANAYTAGRGASAYNNFANMYLNSFSNPAIYGQALYPSSFSQALPTNTGY